MYCLQTILSEEDGFNRKAQFAKKRESLRNLCVIVSLR